MQPRIIIGGYGKLLRLAENVLKEMPVPAGVGIEFLETSVFLLDNAPPRLEPTDLLVCGHQTALVLQELYNTKSIPIRITGYDLLRAISKAIEFSREITILNFHQNIEEIEKYGDLLNVKLKQIIFPNAAALTDILKDLKAQGCRVVIGSSLVCEESEKHGIKSIFIYSQNNVRETLKFAVQMVSSLLQETERAETLKSIFDYTYSGIIGMDQNFCISTFNPAAEKILGLKSKDVIGRPIDHFFRDVKLQEEDGEYLPKVNQLGNFRKKTVVFSSVPIKAEGRYFGQVTVLQDTETIRRAEEKIRRDLHHKRFIAQYTVEDIDGGSAAIRRAIDKAKVFATSDSAVLIVGETGTGKELFAQGIHNLSPRRNRPFVSINCGALTESLLDSELFGYDKGSFTGARTEGKVGLFEMAHTGTIFLDEVGEILPAVQVRLLRVLQEKEVMRIGGDRLIPIDVRIIAATNQDLWQRVREGKFRQDLYYRLNVLELYVPALRERLEDIPELIQSMLAKKAPHMLQSCRSMMNDIIAILQDYAWPGNIRELTNIIERFSTLIQNIKPDQASYKQILQDCFKVRPQMIDVVKAKTPGPAKKIAAISPDEVRRALDESAGNKSAAAKMLGISRMTMFRMLKKQSVANENH